MIKYRTNGFLTGNNLLETLRKADKASQSDKSVEKAQLCGWMAREALEFGEEVEEMLHTPMLSVSSMAVSRWKKVYIKGQDRSMFVPDAWEPFAQRWVLFDIDDINSISRVGAYAFLPSEIAEAAEEHLEACILDAMSLSPYEDACF